MQFLKGLSIRSLRDNVIKIDAKKTHEKSISHAVFLYMIQITWITNVSN